MIRHHQILRGRLPVRCVASGAWGHSPSRAPTLLVVYNYWSWTGRIIRGDLYAAWNIASHDLNEYIGPKV